jgi:hypothetical protein
MSRLQELRANVLKDRKITQTEVDFIRDYVEQDGRLDLDDVKVLVELLTEATEVCAEFDELFFPALKQVVLADGRIGCDEQFYLLKMLYADGHVRDSERNFLVELRREAVETTPEFDSLCETAAKAASRNWDLGGRVR